MKKITAIILTATEWFERGPGNSYFTCKGNVLYNDQSEHNFYIPYTYGYGDHYQDVALKKLYTDGIIPLEENNALWRIAKQQGFKLIAHKIEVARKKDMV